MIHIIVALVALSMMGPPRKVETGQVPSALAPAKADTVYVVIFKHWDWSQPIPLAVEDSVRVYEVKP